MKHHHDSTLRNMYIAIGVGITLTALNILLTVNHMSPFDVLLSM